MSSAAGAGSIWNPGSWHWESRNYNKYAEETLKAKLNSISVNQDGVAVKIVAIPDFKMEATVNIRKGKKILVFETSFTLNWQATAEGDSTSAPVSGQAKVMELMQDDVEDDFEVRVSFTGSSSSAVGEKGHALMRSVGAKQVREHLRQLVKDIMDHDGGMEKLALDAQRRAEEAAKTAEAVASTSAEKERIAKEQALKEAQRKAEEAQKAKERVEAGGADAPKPVAPTGTGSVWNVNSYHWEEKPLTPWAKERLTELVKGFYIDVPGGHVKIVNVELSGEASASIRKGKKLVFFDFKIKANWEGELVDDEGNLLGTGDGELEIPELDQDSEDDYEVRITAAEDGGARDTKLKDLFRTHALQAFKKKIAVFVSEVKARG